jgi:hypothetical protein
MLHGLVFWGEGYGFKGGDLDLLVASVMQKKINFVYIDLIKGGLVYEIGWF